MTLAPLLSVLVAIKMHTQRMTIVRTDSLSRRVIRKVESTLEAKRGTVDRLTVCLYDGELQILG